MAVSAQAVANVFIALAESEGRSLTNMQLQKLVFLSQGYTFAILDRPLYYNDTRAWQWGPVIPKLYKALQKYGRDFVTQPLAAEDALSAESEEMEIVRAVWEGYGHLSGSQLSALTHKADTPWSLAWEREPFSVIDHGLIKAHYLGLLESS